MKKIITLLLFVVALPLSMLDQHSALAQNKPFPQSVDYPGCIKPNHVSQASMNSSVANFYNYWKTSHLKNNLSSLPGGYYVKGHITGDPKGYAALGSSESQGFGMVITVLMAGHDANAQTIFNGLFKTARAFRSENNNNLMGWVVADAHGAQGLYGSATDGDMDIAYSLILAHYQWGSTGAINYLEEAKKMIVKGLKHSNMTTTNRLNEGDSFPKNALDTRPSDWMFSHMRAFDKETGDPSWTSLINNLYKIHEQFSNTYSPNTGLVSDFIIGNPPKPAHEWHLGEFKETDHYFWNACRFPLRVVMDYALYGSDSSKNISNKLVNWVKQSTNNNPAAIKSGYALNGSAIRGGSDAIFIAPFVAASVVNSNNQSFLNKGWDAIKNKRDSYYNDSYNLLSMLFISGNWWKPETTVIPTTPPVAPGNLIATAVSNKQINLTWDDNSDNETGFIIQRSLNRTTNWSTLSTVSTNTTSYSDKGLTASTTYYYKVKAENSLGSSPDTNISSATTPAGPIQSPYSGTPIVIPGVVEAENFDLGGEDLAYHDNSPANEGASYRTTEGVDIESCSAGGYNVGWMRAGEWLEYTVDVTTSGNYTLAISTAAAAATGSLRISMNETTVANNIALTPTTGWQTWKTTKVANVNLSAGKQILRFEVISGNFNLDKVTFTSENSIPTPSAPTNLAASGIASNQINLSWNDTSSNETGFSIERSLNGNSGWTELTTTGANTASYQDLALLESTTYHYRVRAEGAGGVSTYSNTTSATTSAPVSNQNPYGGTPITIPGVVEAENFDLGGESIAFHETSLTNQGGQYRTTENVDIEICTAGGYNVGWTQTGEWLEYTVNVTQEGLYTIIFETASQSSVGSASLKMNGTTILQNTTFPVTGGWQIWKTTKVANVNLVAGQQILRIDITAGDFNLNRVTFTNTAVQDPTVPVVPSNLALNKPVTAIDGASGSPIKLRNLTGESFNSEKIAFLNYPNPTKNSTQFQYQLEESSLVKLDVVDLQGNTITHLVNGIQKEGKQLISWDTTALPSGIYLAKLRINKHSKTIKIQIIK